MTSFGAAKSSHLIVLQWLRSQGCSWGSEICSVRCSVKRSLGSFAMVKESGYPWNSRTYSCVALNGHLEVLVGQEPGLSQEYDGY